MKNAEKVLGLDWNVAIDKFGVLIYSSLVEDEKMGAMEAVRYLGDHIYREDDKGLIRKIVTNKILIEEVPKEIAGLVDLLPAQASSRKAFPNQGGLQ